MPVSKLQDLFVEELRDLYDAEQQITQALPKLAQSASNPELRNAFEEHLDQTREHIRRLDEVFAFLNEPPTGKRCVGVAGIIKEGDELLKMNPTPDVLDAGLIAGAQKVEHY